MRPEHSDEYRARIASSEWQELRCRLITAAGHRCAHCGAGDGPRQLHHKTYERLGRELDRDLVVLCLPCHRKADRARAAVQSVGQYHARLAGWATKVFGEGWSARENHDDVKERFNRWLERREYEGW